MLSKLKSEPTDFKNVHRFLVSGFGNDHSLRDDEGRKR